MACEGWTDDAEVDAAVAYIVVDGRPCVADVGEVEIVVLTLVLVVNADGGLLCVMVTSLTVARKSATEGPSLWKGVQCVAAAGQKPPLCESQEAVDMSTSSGGKCLGLVVRPPATGVVAAGGCPRSNPWLACAAWPDAAVVESAEARAEARAAVDRG